ncbi:MAG: NAD(P)-dependent oxidoreductase [Alphaproteobacteria bacterium]
MSDKRIGFIGLGMMGGPMTGRLLDRGHKLVVLDVDETKIQAAVARGAERASSPKDLASQVDTVIVSLPTPAVVEKVALGPGGLVEGTAIKDYVDLSTTGAVVAKRVAAGLKAKGIEALDCPVSGGEPGAIKGTLAIMVSGNRALYDRVKPYLDVVGNQQFYLGDKAGLGQTMKVANNFMSATNTLVTAEALVMGVKAGLDPKVMLDVINASTGRNNASETKYPQLVLPRKFHSMKSELLLKDLTLCRDEAESLGVPMWLLNTVRQYLVYACARGGAQEPSIGLIRYLEEWAGVQVGEETE